jgi:hypothetical protein
MLSKHTNPASVEEMYPDVLVRHEPGEVGDVPKGYYLCVLPGPNCAQWSLHDSSAGVNVHGVRDNVVAYGYLWSNGTMEYSVGKCPGEPLGCRYTWEISKVPLAVQRCKQTIAPHITNWNPSATPCASHEASQTEKA